MRKIRSALAPLFVIPLVAALQIALLYIFLLSFGGIHVKSDYELIGIYDTEVDQFKEALILYPNYTFFQKVTIKTTGKTDFSTGKWEYDSEDGYISFGEGFISVLNIDSKMDPEYLQHKRGATIPVNWQFGRITLTLGDDYVYTKRKKFLRLKEIFIKQKQRFWN